MQCRNWAQTNPEKVREKTQNWRKANPEKVHERNQKWALANPKKTYKRLRKWRQANQEKCREQSRKWAQANPEKHHASMQTAKIKHRAKRKQAEGLHTTQEWIDLKEQCDNRCLCCKRHQSELDRVLEQDHIVPLSRGGTNWITNIQPLCHDCNGMSSKGTKTIDYRRCV